MDPWAWTLSSTLVVIGWVVTLASTITGWVITARKDRKAAENAARKRDEDAARDRETIDTLKAQLRAAQESASALREQVEQLREANRLAEKANPANVDPWSAAIWISGEGFMVRNEGSRNVVVESVHSDQRELEGMLHSKRETPFMCGPGDTVEYIAFGTDMGRPNVLIEWHWEDDSVTHSTRRVSAK